MYAVGIEVKFHAEAEIPGEVGLALKLRPALKLLLRLRLTSKLNLRRYLIIPGH